MKKTVLLFTALLAMVIVVAVGCSDDDDASTSPTVNTPDGFVAMSIYLDPECYMDAGVIYGYGAVPPNIDSIKIGDSLLVGDSYLDYDYDEEYHENFWDIYFSEDGSDYMYEHGDMAQIRFYGDGQMSSAQFKILDADSAEVTVTEPVYDADTVAADESITVHWERSPEAEHYAVWLEFYSPVNGSDDYLYKYYATNDTFFTVTPSMSPDDVYYFYVNVTPFTGPDPASDAGNVTGGYLVGKVYSFGWYDYTLINGWTVSTKKAAAEGVRKEFTPQQRIEKVYEAYR